MDASGVEFTLLSDVDSAVIEQYGVLNTIVQPTDVPFYGIPFPGFFLVNEEGVIVDKLFNRHLAHREGVESILDSFAGRIVAAPNEPFGSTTEDDGIGVSVFLRGGGGVLRVGPRRRLVVRIDMPDGIHIYGEPVPEGMVATTITIDGPEGFVHDMRDGPPTHAFELPGIDQPLQVWDGTVEFVFDVYASSALRPTRVDGADQIEIEVSVRAQACDDVQCFVPRTRTVRLDIPVGPGAVPNFGEMPGISGETVEMDSATHMARLFERKQPG